MKSLFKSFVKPSQRVIVMICLGLLLTSMTGCSKRYVVTPGNTPVVITKEALNQLYTDNEQLLKALEECQKGCK